MARRLIVLVGCGSLSLSVASAAGCGASWDPEASSGQATQTAELSEVTGLSDGGVPGDAGSSEGGTTTTATYACTATILGSSHPFTSAGSIAASAPAVVSTGATVDVTGFQLAVTIPATLVATAETYGVTWVSGTVDTFDVSATDATPATLNAAAKPIKLPKTTLPVPAKAVVFKVPAAPATIGPWTAGTPGTITFTGGDLTFTMNDNLAVPVPVSCKPSPAVTIATTTVVADAGMPDAGKPDTGMADVGTPDSGMPDTGPADSGGSHDASHDSGGASGTAGSSGNAGSRGSAGSAGHGGAHGSGGAAGTSGAAGSGGGAGSSGSGGAPAGNSGGCGCTVVGAGGTDARVAGLVALAFGVVLRRRRRLG